MRTSMRFAIGINSLAFAANFSFAQSTNSGEIRGTVTDASGAVVVGATVTLVNVDTGESKDFVTNESGIYDTDSTRPGNYKLTFGKAGLQEVDLRPHRVQVSVITVDAALQVGQVQRGGHGRLALARRSCRLNPVTQGTIKEAETMAALPQIGAGITGNDWANFNIFLPGASSSPSRRSRKAVVRIMR